MPQPASIRLIPMAALTCLLLAACAVVEPAPQLIAPDIPTVTPSPLPPTLTPTPVPTGVLATLPPTPTPIPTPGPCSHLLWPLRSGAVWSYRLTLANGSVDLTLSAAEADGSMMLTSSVGFSGLLYCGGGTLAGMPPLPVGHPDLGFGVTGINPAGDYLPAPASLLPLGQPATWDQELDAGGTIVLPFSADPLLISSGKIVMISSTQALTTLNVPAGDFLALPVRQDVFYDITVALPDGSSQSVIISASSMLYYAEDAGLLKVTYEEGTISTPSGAWTLAPGPVLELLSVTWP